ncbi:MAG: hypothetical protein MHM6MM_002537 [Cercozoa sp. M6MM]
MRILAQIPEAPAIPSVSKQEHNDSSGPPPVVHMLAARQHDMMQQLELFTNPNVPAFTKQSGSVFMTAFAPIKRQLVALRRAALAGNEATK